MYRRTRIGQRVDGNHAAGVRANALARLRSRHIPHGGAMSPSRLYVSLNASSAWRRSSIVARCERSARCTHCLPAGAQTQATR